MQFKTDVKKIGGSVGIIIPAKVTKQLEIEEFDDVEIIIKKIEKEMVLVHCKNCLNTFTSVKQDVYDCLFCDSTIYAIDGEVKGDTE